MASLVIPKSRRVRFHLHLHIQDLNNVPLVSGTSFIKWHLPSSTAAEHRGRTPKCAIKDHRVVYDHAKSLPVRLTVGKDGVLQTCEVHFEVVQEYSAGGRAERLVLGEVKLNLAEYAQATGAEGPPSAGGAGAGAGTGANGLGEEGIVRRYLMQESKINSTLKIGISMKHIEGIRDYIAPALRTAPAFGGIAGIISPAEPAASSTHGGASNAGNGDAGRNDLSNSTAALPTLSATNREMGEMQDMYRRTLAAYWASQPGEMRADECIEDIFSGGDGWGKNGRPLPITADENQQHPALLQNGSGSGSSTPNMDSGTQRSRPGPRAENGIKMGAGRRSGVGHKHGKKGRAPLSLRAPGEIDEFDIREDLRSWTVGEVGRT
ncbi:hypothetical protein B0A54_16020 [Friedmanniomyces endolithicus]|uniref:C2 NT-type domain-containing protein n=1 Tax=Friedmanniomyces endolithicus TaxID=329885 RepID=A0A4U0U1L4_9PEZI|nr:hypothetical protein LTS09_005969 [Friedmanniomyces endolithicus]KAK0312771.1 hypothetical protein LTR01_002433 [Friedmanniomyces endolithicus]KAK0827486.1 hypothetical protein LTR73_005725 [Friedmanniomyces endolithicus]TKA28831.1 hypothetical protein B0A54_16020 [Friedmanniomyces endolithicus]